MSILKKLFGLKSAADFAEAIPQLQAELDAAEARVAAANARMRRAPFEEDGAADLVGLRNAVRDAELEVESITALIEETAARQAEAAERERAAEVEARIKAVAGDLRRQQQYVEGWLQTLADIARALPDMRATQERLLEVNQMLEAEGLGNRRLQFTRVHPDDIAIKMNVVAVTLGRSNADYQRFLRGEA